MRRVKVALPVLRSMDADVHFAAIAGLGGAGQGCPPSPRSPDRGRSSSPRFCDRLGGLEKAQAGWQGDGHSSSFASALGSPDSVSISSKAVSSRFSILHARIPSFAATFPRSARRSGPAWHPTSQSKFSRWYGFHPPLRCCRTSSPSVPGQHALEALAAVDGLVGFSRDS